MLRRINNYINRSISRRILFFFLPYIIILLVTITLFCFNSFYDTLRNEKENSTEILVAQISDNFDHYFKDIKTIMAYISINKDVYQALTEYNQMSIVDKYYLNNRIRDYTSNVNVFKNYINDIIIIGKNGYYNNLGNYYALSEEPNLNNRAWINNYIPSENSNFSFTSPHKADYYTSTAPILLVVSSILPLTDQGKTLGYLQGDLDYAKMNDLLNTVYRQNDIDITMVTSGGNIVFNRENQKINTRFDSEIFDEIKGNAGSFVNRGNSDSSLIVYRRSDVTGWFLIASIPYSALLSPGYSISIKILLIILPISLVLALVIFVLISNQFRKPLSKLVYRIENVDITNYRPVDIDYGVGEIADVGRKFETMLAKINELIEQVYLAEIKKKNAEFELLRHQITPHFMYNSLQLIKAEAIFSKNKQISQIVTSLANLLRYSMDNQASFVTVADEIQYIRGYLEIYKRRFVGKFEYQIDVDAAIMGCKMQKIILQPVVENCIKHGFEGLKSGGLIKIRGWRDEDGCIFEITDNGKGISFEKTEQLMQEFEKSDQSKINGIGLLNVHQRLVLECGENYGITGIVSKEGEYLQIILKTKG
jgi:two-component system sensor histidine kinase YesM